MSEDGYDISEFLKERIHGVDKLSPWLSFYEIVPKGGGDPIRFVGYANPKYQGVLPDTVGFNGDDYRSATVRRRPITGNIEGNRDAFTVTIADERREAAQVLRTQSGLDGATVRIWLTTASGIDTPENAYPEEYFLTEAELEEAPRNATITLGYPNLYEERFPGPRYDRYTCLNNYFRRFQPGNLCRYPSNEFGGKQKQDYLAGGAFAAQKRLYGWSTQQARQAAVFDANFTTAHKLTVEVSTSYLGWIDERRYGPNLFREISGDFEVELPLELLDTTRDGWFAGLLVQDEAGYSPAPSSDNENPADLDPDRSSWLLWAVEDDGAAGRELVKRVTDDDLSADTVVSETDLFLRVRRTGDLFELYSKAAEGDQWTLRESETLVLPETVRVGIACGSTASQLTTAARFAFEYIRFTAGALPTCDLSYEDCQAHENTHDNNAFRAMPNDRVTL